MFVGANRVFARIGDAPRLALPLWQRLVLSKAEGWIEGDLFADDRELLECLTSGLKEYLTFESTRYTYRVNAIDVDAGLRLPELDDDGVSTCPGCGGEVRGEWL